MTIKPPRMTPLSWNDTRQALGQLFANCDALKAAIDGDLVDGKLTSRPLVASQAMLSLTFWGRLRWLLTGRIA